MGKIVNALVGLVAWVAECNYGRAASGNDTEDQRNEHASMLRFGWWETSPLVIVKMTSEKLAVVMERLAQRWAALKGSDVDTTFIVDGKNVVLTPSEILRAFEDTFVRKGKLVEPEYEAIFGFQRGNALLGALALRLKLGIKGEFMLPCILKDFASEYERVQMCVMENTGKVAGARLIDTHWPSLVRASVSLRDACKAGGNVFKEIDCIRVISGGAEKVKRGTGQKAFYIACLDARFPDLKLAELIQSMEASTEDCLRGNDLGKGLDRNELQKLEIGSRIPLPEKAEVKSEEDVSSYFADPKSEDQKGPVMVKRANAYGHANTTNILVVKFIIQALYSGNLTELNRLSVVAAELNAAFVKSGIQIVKEEKKK
jgi:hypothetical protein